MCSQLSLDVLENTIIRLNLVCTLWTCIDKEQSCIGITVFMCNNVELRSYHFGLL